MNSKKVLVGVLLVAMVVANALVIFNSAPVNNGKAGEDHANTITYPKSTHAVIRINGDSDFDTAHGVTGGNGDQNHPYVISGWTIDAQGKGVGIYIANTTQNFTIENCEVYNASGGDYGVYYPNSGIFIYNAKATYIHIQENKLHNNNAAGLHISSVTAYEIFIEKNRIYLNSRAGIYANTAYGLANIDYNMIFNNDVGIHLYKTDSGSVQNHIYYNGIANHNHEGIRVEDATNENDIYSNVFYRNYGTDGHFDPSKSQASQSNSPHTYWLMKYGNFWYDLAMNNETNYNKTTLVINRTYPIGGSDGHFDYYPLKGVKHDQVWMDWWADDLNDSKTFTVENGVIAGLGTEDLPYIISGWNISDANGYGFVFNGSFSAYTVSGDLIPKYITVDGLMIKNIASRGSGLLSSGIGMGFNFTRYGVFKIENVTIHDCDNYGIAMEGYINPWRPATIDHSYIYYNLAGIGMFKENDNVPYAKVINTTIDGNSHGGIYFVNGSLDVVNALISHNDIGVDIEGGGYVKISYSSFYKNTRWGVYVGSEATKPTISENVFYGNNGASGTYSSSHIQAYAASDANFDRNVYYDWINNNRSNDLNNDSIIDWPYKIEGGGNVEDANPMKWVHIGYPIYIDGDDIFNIAPYRGTGYGLIGGKGTSSEPYLILGWNVTEANTNGLTATISVKNITKNLDIRYVRASGEMNDGIYLYNDSSLIHVYNSLIINNYFVGLRIEKTPFFDVEWNDMMGARSVAALEIYDVDGGWAYVQNNRVYRNTYGGDGIIVNDWDRSATGLGLWIMYNQIFANDNGTYIYRSSNVMIEYNGFAYNRHYGVVMMYSDGNKIIGNMFYYNNNSHDGYNPHHLQAYDNGNNIWNTSGNPGHGNYWQDWALNNYSNDNNYDYIIDYPYHIAGGDNVDEYPYLYVNHNPIRINNVGDLDWNHGCIGGDGSSQYPYVLLGWNINNANNGYGIYIGNITGVIYFRIEHCMATSASGGSGDAYHDNSGIIINSFAGYEFDIYDSVAGYNQGNGLTIRDSWYIDIWGSYFQGSYNGNGVSVYDSHYVSVSYTNMSNNKYDGLHVASVENLNIEYNVFYKNGGDGAWIYSTTINDDLYGNIYNNTFRNNTDYGVMLVSSSGFTIYHNIFDRNNGASGDGQYDSNHIQAYDSASSPYTNKWNSTTEGNCWSDYTGTGAYTIDGGSSKDYQPGCAFVPEFNSIFIAIFLVALLGVILRRKH